MPDEVPANTRLIFLSVLLIFTNYLLRSGIYSPALFNRNAARESAKETQLDQI